MNVERVTPKTLEREKAAEYALAVCKEGLGKSGVKKKISAAARSGRLSA